MLARATPGSASFGGNGRSEGPFGAALRLARTHVASRSRGRFVWVTGVEQHETVSRRVVGWLRWQAHRMRSAATQRGSFRWRGVLWGVMACYAVVVAGLSTLYRSADSNTFEATGQSQSVLHIWWLD